MKSVARPSFWRSYAKLDERARQAAQRSYSLFEQNADHPSLRFKKLRDHSNAWSVRIGEQYRAVGERYGDTIEWSWIGTHNEFDNLFS